MKTIKDVEVFLAENNWIKFKKPEIGKVRDIYAWGLENKEGIFNCDENEKPPRIIVRLYPENALAIGVKEIIEMEIYGKADDVWFHVNPYSISPEYFMDNYYLLMTAICASWNIFYSTLSPKFHEK